jgi:hypothetical protein
MIKIIAKREQKKGCMPFCHSHRSFISEVVSIRRRKIIRQEETCKAASRG